MSGEAIGAVVGAAARLGAPLVVIDFEHHRLPDRLVATSAVGGAVLLVLAGAIRHDWHSRRASLKTAVAFGPVLVFGALLVLAFDLGPSLGAT